MTHAASAPKSRATDFSEAAAPFTQPPKNASLAFPPEVQTTSEVAKIALLLGGAECLGGMPEHLLDVHQMLVAGLPSRALRYLTERMAYFDGDALLEPVFGLSPRSFQHMRGEPGRLLDIDQGSRAWRFATILDKCMLLFGTRKDAEEWLSRPAMALNRMRPIDLLATCAGAAEVETML